MLQCRIHGRNLFDIADKLLQGSLQLFGSNIDITTAQHLAFHITGRRRTPQLNQRTITFISIQQEM